MPGSHATADATIEMFECASILYLSQD